jgi:hypothetical protein
MTALRLWPVDKDRKPHIKKQIKKMDRALPLTNFSFRRFLTPQAGFSKIPVTSDRHQSVGPGFEPDDRGFLF